MHRLRKLFAIAVTVFAGIGPLAKISYAETRVALVIGNGAYQNAPRLPNPANDAADVAASLKRSGFETILATDLDKTAMDAATIRFARVARTADVAMFYYSGHALQFGGVNYLAPVDAKLTDEADLRRMVRVDEIVSDLQQAKNLRFLVLDSCRDNPLADELKRSIGTTRALPLQRGLARIDSPQGMIVAYATQSGRTADDGVGRNSPYTAAFVKNIEAQDEIGTIFRRISADVYETTQHNQLPELSLSLIGEFYLKGKVELQIKSEPSAQPDTTQRDFEATERVDTVPAWDAFLAQHPSGFYSSLARERRTKAEAKMSALGANPPLERPPQKPVGADDLDNGTTNRKTPEGDIVFDATKPGGLTTDQIVLRLHSNDMFSGPVTQQPREGSLLPGIFKFHRGTSRDEVLHRMQTEQLQALSEIWQKRNPDLPLSTPEQLVIVASIVERETNKDDERSRVAAVFINRFRQSMKLQSDPTLIYGLVGGKGSLGRPIKRSEIFQPSPYNTYVNDGLPPGPISNPGRASLEATANPASTRDLFFVADGAGGHAFAETYDQHQKNVARLRAIHSQNGAGVDEVEWPGNQTSNKQSNRAAK
jgi:uncharacterized caspase-like protein